MFKVRFNNYLLNLIKNSKYKVYNYVLVDMNYSLKIKNFIICIKK